jgi:hypothetical protein
MSKLTIELVPQTCWFSNVRDHVSPATWDRLRRHTYRQANYRCEICGGKGNKHPVECHEIWHYDDVAKHQKLVGLVALCPSCHQVKHMGLATLKGKRQEATQHLANVNHWSQEETEHYIDSAFQIWQERSLSEWTLDLSWLKENFGLDVKVKR